MSNSNKTAIRVDNVSKVYNIYRKPSDILMERFSSQTKHEKLWALQNISFEVKRGEIVGIIGQNGAGKSTLLRIIANTLDATSGQVVVNGKLSTLMILGTGFNLELSGRENILIGGLCLGMTRAEIEEKRQSIIDFSGLEDYIDNACKTYSTGMLQRLAFSIAISNDPDILIIDEVLAVGDAVFVVKCYDRIRKLKANGTTILLVSHDMQSIYDLCDQAILLEHGKIVMTGEPRVVGYEYLKFLIDDRNELNKEPPTNNEKKQRTQQKEDLIAEIKYAAILNEFEEETDQLKSDEKYTIRIKVHCKKDIPSISIGYHIQHQTGTIIYGTSTAVLGYHQDGKTAELITMDFSLPCLFIPGEYFAYIGISEQLSTLKEHYHYWVLDYICDAIKFTVCGPVFAGGLIDLQSHITSINSTPLPS